METVIMRPHENGVSGTASDHNADSSTWVNSDDNDTPAATQAGADHGHAQKAAASALDGKAPPGPDPDLSQSETAALATSVDGDAAGCEPTDAVQAHTAQDPRPFQEPFMETAIYGRVATRPDQLQDPLDAQIMRCTAAAEEAGYRVQEDHIFRDVGSGNCLEHEGLQALLAAVRAQEVNAVLVYDVDRLSRDPLHVLTVLKECDDNNVALHVVSGPADLAGTSDFIAAIKSLRRQQEPRMPVGNTIFGYDYDPSARARLVNPGEAEIVREIFERVAAGESANRIAKDLNQRGVPRKHGASWVATAVIAIIKRTSYCGVDYYGRTRRTVSSLRGRRKIVQVEARTHEWIECNGFSPPLISREMFEAAQHALQGRKRGTT